MANIIPKMPLLCGSLRCHISNDFQAPLHPAVIFCDSSSFFSKKKTSTKTSTLHFSSFRTRGPSSFTSSKSQQCHPNAEPIPQGPGPKTSRQLQSSIRLVASPRSDFTWFPGYAREPKKPTGGVHPTKTRGGPRKKKMDDFTIEPMKMWISHKSRTCDPIFSNIHGINTW